MSPKKKHNVIIFVHAFKISSFTALKSLLPNGLIRDTPISDEESKRLNAHINRDKLRRVIKDQDRILVICIMGDCRDNLDLLHPKCMKASNWVSKHIPNCHSDAIRTTLEHEILIHSFFDVLGTSVFKNMRFDTHYLLVNIVGTTKFSYVGSSSITIDLKDASVGSKLPSSSTSTTHSNESQSRANIASHGTGNTATAPAAPSSDNVMIEMMKQMSFLQQKMDMLLRTRTDIRTYTQPIHIDCCAPPRNAIYCIPKCPCTAKAFINVIGKHMAYVTYILPRADGISVGHYRMICKECNVWRNELAKHHRNFKIYIAKQMSEDDASNSSTRSDEDDDLQQAEVSNVHEPMDIEGNDSEQDDANEQKEQMEIEFNSIYDKFVGGCSHECDGEMFICVLCSGWECCSHFNEKHKDVLIQFGIPPMDQATLDFAIEFNLNLTCHDCIEKVILPLQEHLEYVRDYCELQYGDDGRNSMSRIETTDDYAWLVMSSDLLIDEFKDCDDAQEYIDLMNNRSWMSQGLDEFKTLIKRYREATASHPTRLLLPSLDTEIVRDVLLMKQKIMHFIVDHKQVIRSDCKKEHIKFRKQLWRMIDNEINTKHRNIKFLHDLELCTAKNETGMETCASEMGKLYSPLRRCTLNENLKKKYVNYRSLPHNLKMRRKITKKVKKMHQKKFKSSGLLKSKRR
eukprot:733142_1